MQDVYFDDDSAEVVISSLRLGDDQGRWVFILSLAGNHIRQNVISIEPDTFVQNNQHTINNSLAMPLKQYI